MPSGAHAGQLTLEALHLRERAGRLRHARRPREPARPALAPDRASDHAHPRARRPPRRADLPAPGRPRHHEHGLPRREPLHRPPRRRARRLPRHRRLLAPRLPRGHRVERALARPAQHGVARLRRRRLPRLRRAASRRTASISPATRCPSASTTSSSHAATLGYGQIDLVSESAGTRTAMIYAWRYPQSIHRSVMIGVNPPGNFLWNAEDDRRADPSLRRALRRRTQDCRSRTPDLAASMHSGLRARSRAASGSCRSRRATSGVAGFFGLINATSRRRRPARGAADDRHAPLRSTRATAPAARGCSRSSPRSRCSRTHRSGATSPPIGRTDAAYGRRFFAAGADRGSVIGSPGTELVWAGGRLLDAWPANPDENEYTRVRDSQRPDAADRRPARLRHAAAERDPRAPAPPPERPPGRPAEARSRRRLLGLRARRRRPG